MTLDWTSALLQPMVIKPWLLVILIMLLVIVVQGLASRFLRGFQPRKISTPTLIVAACGLAFAIFAVWKFL